jgi:serine/threonine protein phosphatase PrpC
LLDGKFFLLCTDGLSKEVSERSIEQALLPGICSLACARNHNERTHTLQGGSAATVRVLVEVGELKSSSLNRERWRW